jgi:hypothetical protein
MNSLPVILTYFMQGGGKCLFFAITSLLIQLWIAQIQGQYSSDQEESLEYILEDYHGIIYFELL